MTTLLDYVFGFFQNYQENVQDPDNASPNILRFWPRKLNYTTGSDAYNDEETENDCNMICDGNDDEDNEEEDQCELGDFSRGEEGEEEACPCEPSRFARKMKLVSRAAKYGMKEGALCGIFFGGGWGIYKWIDVNYLNKKASGEGESGEAGEAGEGENDESGESDSSTANTNFIFVTALNSAITMGLLCTFICCTKAMVYCS